MSTTDISVCVTNVDAKAAAEQFKEALKGLGFISLADMVKLAKPEAVEAAPAKKPRGKTLAEASVEAVAEPAVTYPTQEELYAILQKCAATDGIGPEAAFQLLKDANEKKVSTVPPEKRQAIIDAANAKLSEVA